MNSFDGSAVLTPISQPGKQGRALHVESDVDIDVDVGAMA